MCEKKTIVELREIYSCLALGTNIGAKAFMTFLLSSGMDRNQARELTIEDLIVACKIDPILDMNHFVKYGNDDLDSGDIIIKFNVVDDDLLKIMLKRNPDNITPIWIKEDDNKIKLNFSSPESLFYIFLHLKERRNSKNLKIEDKLFDISDNIIDDSFKISEHLTDIGSYYPISADAEVISHKFTTKTLKKFFINQYLKHSPDYDNGKQRKYEGKYYSQYKVNLIKLFTSGLPKDDAYCKKFLNNTTRLLIDYKKVLPYITAKNYDIIRPSWNEISDWERDFNAKVEKIMNDNNKVFTDIDVYRILSNHVESNDDVDMQQLIKFALDDNKIGCFDNSPAYLNNLLLKPHLKKDIESIITEDFELHPLTYEPTIREIISKLDDKSIFEKYNIDKRIFAYNIKDYLNCLEDKGKPIYLTNTELLELCFASLMGQY